MIFFKESKSEKNHFLEGVKVREDWLVYVHLFYKDSKLKKKLRGVGGGGEGGGEDEGG